MEDEVRNLENEGRKIVYGIISGHCSECYFTPNRFDNVDLFITGKTGVEAVMEIKNRTGYTSQEIDRLGGHILERNKLNALLSYEGYKPLYTIVYPNEMIIWNVSDINNDRFQVEDKYPDTTAIKGHKVPKSVVYLKRDEACCIIHRNK